MTERVQPIFPSSYLLIRFEELISDALAIADELYSFLGYQAGPPDQVRDWIRDHGHEKLDLQAGSAVYPQRWNATHIAAVEEECKPLIIKMGLPFQQLDIKYTQSYY